jgi:hypothetical protein
MDILVKYYVLAHTSVGKAIPAESDGYQDEEEGYDCQDQGDQEKLADTSVEKEIPSASDNYEDEDECYHGQDQGVQEKRVYIHEKKNNKKKKKWAVMGLWIQPAKPVYNKAFIAARKEKAILWQRLIKEQDDEHILQEYQLLAQDERQKYFKALNADAASEYKSWVPKVILNSLATPDTPARLHGVFQKLHCLNTCLVDSLRSLGFKVGYHADGPFWALGDGNSMLQAFNAHLEHMPNARAWSHLPAGKYILAVRNHFVALRIFDDQDIRLFGDNRTSDYVQDILY